MIVLTDGRANPVGPDAAVREADAAKADNIVIFTIGLGEDLNLDALEAMASKPSHYYRAPDGEVLADIYAEIAVEIPCPSDRYWGKR
jgi:secreted protein with Ig-like and vWFA domain